MPVGRVEAAPAVESALGVQHMASIACASPRVVDVYAEAEAAGRASAALDGKMIDTPVVERARTTLARAAAIERLEARKGAVLEAAGEAPR